MSLPAPLVPADGAQRVQRRLPHVFFLVGRGGHHRRNGRRIAQLPEREDRVDARLHVRFLQRVDQQRRRATVAEVAEDHAEVAADAGVIVFRGDVDRRDLLLEIGIALRLSALQRFRELIRGLPSLMRAARSDVVQVVGNRVLFRRELPEQKEDRHTDDDDPQREHHELEKDVAGGLFRDIRFFWGFHRVVTGDR